MAIRIRYTYKQLTALNEAWECLDHLRANTAEQRALISVMQDMAVKLKRKAVSLEYSYIPTSEYTTTLKDHEAYFYERYLREVVKNMPLGYSRTVINSFADRINQKLA